MEENTLILVRKETRKKIKILAVEREMTMIDLIDSIVDSASGSHNDTRKNKTNEKK